MFPKPSKRKLTRHAIGISRSLSLMCAVLSSAILLGYLFGIEPFYRPIPGGPATSPLSAISIIAISLAFYVRSARNRLLTNTLIIISFGVLAARTLDLFNSGYFNHHILTLIAPKDFAFGDPKNQMGINTLITLTFLTLSAFFRIKQFPSLSQLAGFFASVLPTLSITGYIYQLTSFYGSMSLLTTLFTLLLCIIAFCITSNHGIMCAVLSPHLGGKLARLQIIGSYCFTFGLGYVVVQSTHLTIDDRVFQLYVFSTHVFIVLLAVFSATLQERNTRKRRSLERELRRLATRDALTGQLNRKAIDLVAQKEIEKQKRTGAKLGILMIDIDHFKNINDTFGHTMGDVVLAAVAKAISRTVRKSDYVGRYGGEEFIVILTVEHYPDIRKVAEKIRQSIASLHIVNFTDQHGPITASIGGMYITNETKLEDAVKKADQELYKAKANGRNCVMMPPEPGTERGAYQI